MSHSFLPGLLPADAIVFDLGANRGTFSSQVHERFGWRCVAVEPNPEMLRQIPQRDGITRINAAAAASNGPLVLNVSSNPESSSLLPLSSDSTTAQISVSGMTLEALREAAQMERIDLLKMDIEGAEIQLLSSVADEQWRAIRQITIEFHESMGLSTLADVRNSIAHLKQLGFEPLKMSLTHYGDVLFVNRRLCGTSAVSLARLKYLTRNVIWARRAWERARSN